MTGAESSLSLGKRDRATIRAYRLEERVTAGTFLRGG